MLHTSPPHEVVSSIVPSPSSATGPNLRFFYRFFGTPKAPKSSDHSEIYEISVAQPTPFNYEMKISCVNFCFRPINWVKSYIEMPLGMYLTSTTNDGQNIIASFWQGPTAEVIRIYAIRSGVVKQLLQTGTKSYPSIRIDKRGYPELFIYQNSDITSDGKFDRGTLTKWRMTAAGYQPSTPKSAH